MYFIFIFSLIGLILGYFHFRKFLRGGPITDKIGLPLLVALLGTTIGVGICGILSATYSRNGKLEYIYELTNRDTIEIIGKKYEYITYTPRFKNSKNSKWFINVRDSIVIRREIK